jgi:protoporphyrinogen oxidase
MSRIVAIGSGISGLAAAYYLSRRHDVFLFEKEARVGGHTHTVTIESSGRHSAGWTHFSADPSALPRLQLQSGVLLLLLQSQVRASVNPRRGQQHLR